MDEAITDVEPRTSDDADEPVKLFGDPRSGHVRRGPDRRVAPDPLASDAAVPDNHVPDNHVPEGVRADGEWHIYTAGRHHDFGRALRLGRGDSWATALNVLGMIVLVVSVVAGVLILNNAQDVGAFDDPFNSNRVAIGISVLGLGIVHAAILIGVARAITYQLAGLRLRLRDLDG